MPDPVISRPSWAEHFKPQQRRSSNRKALVAGVAVAAALGGAALFNRAKSRRAERDNPPVGRFIEVDGVRLHYVERGQGRPLVLHHGNGAMLQDMEASGIIDRAAARYRVIAFDRPGFGYSERPRHRLWTPTAQAELIHKALRQLGIEKPIVVGHSWGTLVTLALALDHPDDVAAIVLLSGYYFPTARLDVPLMSGPAIPIVGDVMRYTVSPLVGRLMGPAAVRRIFSPAPVAEGFADFPFELALRPSQIRAVSADTALMLPDAMKLSRRYRELSLPVIIVTGDGDKIVECEQAYRLHAAIPDSELRVVPGTGHMVHYTAPDDVLAAIDLASQRAAGQPDQSAVDQTEERRALPV